MSNSPELFLPEGFALTDSDYEVIDDLARKSLSDYREAIPTVESYSDGQWQTRFLRLRDENEGQSSKAVAVYYPFANGNSPQMLIRAMVQQALMPEDTQLIIFPNNTRSEKYQTPYDLCGAHPTSSIDQLAKRSLRAIEALGIEELAISGDSQGASVGAAVLKLSTDVVDIPGGSASLRDSGNMFSRKPGKLTKAFRKTGTGNLNRAINDSGIPALSEAQLSRGGTESVLQILRFVKFGLIDSRDPNNQVLHRDMARGGFVPTLEEAHDNIGQGTHVTLYERSLISRDKTEEFMLRRVLGDNGGEFQIIPGYGHEGGDNVVLSALLARRAFIAGGFFNDEVTPAA